MQQAPDIKNVRRAKAINANELNGVLMAIKNGKQKMANVYLFQRRND